MVHPRGAHAGYSLGCDHRLPNNELHEWGVTKAKTLRRAAAFYRASNYGDGARNSLELNAP